MNKSLSPPGSPFYAKWHEQVLKFRHGEPPPHARAGSVYPNIKVEWYRTSWCLHALAARAGEVRHASSSTTPRDRARQRDFVEAEQKAYDETALEDKEICDRMTEGRRALWLEGREEHGPYQSPMEDGMVHFHEFMRRELAQHL